MTKVINTKFNDRFCVADSCMPTSLYISVQLKYELEQNDVQNEVTSTIYLKLIILIIGVRNGL